MRPPAEDDRTAREPRRLPPLHNPRAERVRSLARLGQRSGRRRDPRFLAEGPQAVREALLATAGSSAGPPIVTELYLTERTALRHPELTELARSAGLEPREASEAVLAALSGTVTPQGVVAVCRTLDIALDDLLARRPHLVAVLVGVSDPGNAGTIIRAATAAGAEGVVLTEGAVDPYNPKCVRATTGSLFHVPMVIGAPFVDLVAAVRAAGLAVLATDGDGALDLDRALDAGAGGPLAHPLALLFGNEAAGLSDAERDAADAVLSIPRYGRAESLNVATAATVCLFAAARAQRSRGGCRTAPRDDASW